MDGQCAKCPYGTVPKRCTEPENGAKPDFCCTELYGEALKKADAEYAPYLQFAAEATRQENSCYVPSIFDPDVNMAIKPRIAEIIEFCGRMGYKKLGLAFCGGLHREAATLIKLLETAGFEVVSVVCKVGGRDKTRLGLAPEERINKKGAHESMCNPIGQAEVLKAAGTEFNLVLGLCVGHDSLFLRHSQALCTVVAVKDRVTGHNPLAALYNSDSYYKYLKKPRKG